MNLYVLLLLVLLNEGGLALQLVASYRSIARSYLAVHALVLAATAGALFLAPTGGFLYLLLAALSIGGFLYATVAHAVLMSRFARQADQVRFKDALRTLSWLRWFPSPIPIDQQRAVIEDHETLRRGDATVILAERREALRLAIATQNPSVIQDAAITLIHALVLSRHWREAADIHQGMFAGQFGSLPPVTVAMLARAYGTLGDLGRMTRAVADLEYRRDRISDAGSLNFARVVYLSHQGAADEIDFLLSRSSGLLAGAPPFVRPFYRGIAHYRAGHVDRAHELFEQARKLAPEDDRPVLKDSVESFLRCYQDREIASLDASERTFVQALLERIEPYTAVPRTGLAIADLPVTWAIVGLNILIWSWMALRGDTTDPAFLIDAGALYSPAVRSGEWWRLVAPIFLHAGIMHIALNSLGLLYLGRLTERLYGSGAFLLVYAVTGVAGTIASYAMGQGVSVGASGAIFGVLGALIALLVKGRARFPEAWRSRYLNLMLILAAINIFFGMQVESVDNAAHIGGLVGGLLLGSLLARRRIGQERPRPVRALLGVLQASLLVTAGLVVFHVATTTRAETMERIPPQDLTIGAAQFGELPGTWLLRERVGGGSVLFDPFATSGLEISVAPSVPGGGRFLVEAAASAARAKCDPDSTPVFGGVESRPVQLWRYAIRRRGLAQTLIFVPAAGPDGIVRPLIVIYDTDGPDEVMARRLLAALR